MLEFRVQKKNVEKKLKYLVLRFVQRVQPTTQKIELIVCSQSELSRNLHREARFV